MNNYELHSLFDQGSQVCDLQRYNQVLHHYPDNLVFTHESSLVITDLMTYTCWHQDVLDCVSAWCCMAVSKAHLNELLDTRAERYCDLTIAARHASNHSTSLRNLLYANYFDTISDIVEFVDNALIDSNAPYFENMLAYRLMCYSTYNRTLLFTKIPYSELKDNYKRCNRLQM